MEIVKNLSLTEDAERNLRSNYKEKDMMNIDHIHHVHTYTHYAWLNEDNSIKSQGVRLVRMQVFHELCNVKYSLFDNGKKVFGVAFSDELSELKYLEYDKYDENHHYTIDYIDGVNYIIKSNPHQIITEMLDRIRITHK
jgi:hypothetical protein